MSSWRRRNTPGGAGGFDVLEASEEIAARSPLQLFWRRLRKDRVAMVSLGFVVFLVIVAIAAPLIVKILGLPGPYVQNLNLTDEFGSPLGPSGAHPFGVDQLGHDVMSRVIYGTRVSLEVGIVGTSIATVIGVSFGLVAGYYRGWVDTLLSRTVDVVLSIPGAAAGPGHRRRVRRARLPRRRHLAGHQRDHLPDRAGQLDLHLPHRARARAVAARARVRRRRAALGASNARIMFREILPNLVAPVIVYATLLIPLNILLEASLSFLGVGVRPPTASWGQMIAAATPIFNTAWWYMTFPGLALLFTVLAFNLLGDGLRDALNPRTAR